MYDAMMKQTNELIWIDKYDKPLIISNESINQ